jgi:2-polyprenyl-3-methyl-5-hydroxy-6-metoxy-1,4-benzoquinol methylase
MPDLEWNHATWNETYPWEKDGEEWSVAWDGSRSQWYGAIYPRINNFLPVSRILEIAPGRGRWTQFLLGQCTEYYGVDISAKCIDFCKRKFAANSRVHFWQNDGRSLAMIPDDYIDFVFSYDSLVHVEGAVLRNYMWQLCQKLTKSGVAFIHHSNALGDSVDPHEVAANLRATSVSAKLVKEMIEDSGGKTLIQEEVNWGTRTRIDCMTTFCREGAYAGHDCEVMENNDFMTEATLIRQFHSHYNLR